MYRKVRLLATVCVAFLLLTRRWVPSVTILFWTGVFGLFSGCFVLPSLFFLRRTFGPLRRGTVGFFHPHAEDGGGGERVLWSAIRTLQAEEPELHIVLFTGRGYALEELLSRARRNFNLQIDGPIELVPLSRVAWLDPQNYGFLTLLRQALASLRVGSEALRQCLPEIFVDTTGWAFTYPLAWWLGVKIVCYVHYPTISTDMLSRIQSKTATYNNAQYIARSHFFSLIKVLYYALFAGFYRLAGNCVHLALVNSTWTCNHIKALWGRGNEVLVVYPPADTHSLQELPITRGTARPHLISVAQFRPEKDHALQLRAYARALEDAGRRPEPDDPILSSSFKIVGSCRHEGDRARLCALKALAHELGLQQHAEFYENLPYPALREMLGGAVAGLHTMVDEHFGIGVVEYMAAGVIPIAHDSGGPKLDILSGSGAGFLKVTVEDYADAIAEVLRMHEHQRSAMAEQCRENSLRFSQENFEKSFYRAMRQVLHPE